MPDSDDFCVDYFHDCENLNCAQRPSLKHQIFACLIFSSCASKEKKDWIHSYLGNSSEITAISSCKTLLHKA